MRRRLMVDVSTFEDQCVDLRRSMCQLVKINALTSKTDDRCEIMLLHLLKTLIQWNLSYMATMGPDHGQIVEQPDM